jgi:hypothetical protein
VGLKIPTRYRRVIGVNLLIPSPFLEITTLKGFAPSICARMFLSTLPLDSRQGESAKSTRANTLIIQYKAAFSGILPEICHSFDNTESDAWATLFFRFAQKNSFQKNSEYGR